MQSVSESGREAALDHFRPKADERRLKFTGPFLNDGRKSLIAAGKLVEKDAGTTGFEFTESSEELVSVLPVCNRQFPFDRDGRLQAGRTFSG